MTRVAKGMAAPMKENAKTPGAPANDTEPSPVISDRIQEQIGNRLKALFDETTSQPIPQRFTELLEALSEREVEADGGEDEVS
jgi:hypothetical protein